MKNKDNPKAVLIEFMAAMFEWETNFVANQDVADEGVLDEYEVRKLFMGQLKNILERYSVESVKNRGRLIDLGCTVPPMYNPEEDFISEVASDKEAKFIEVHQRSGFRGRFRFKMEKVTDRWLIIEKDRLDAKNHWIPSVL